VRKKNTVLYTLYSVKILISIKNLRSKFRLKTGFEGREKLQIDVVKKKNTKNS